MVEDPPGTRPQSPEDHFLDELECFVRAVRRARGSRSGGGLTLSQYGLLEPLRQRKFVRVRELADHAGISAPTATSILRTLERRGLVIRRMAPEDRRGVVVSLTERGRELLAARHEWILEEQRQLFHQMDATERLLAPALLARLAALVDRMAAGPGS